MSISDFYAWCDKSPVHNLVVFTLQSNKHENWLKAERSNRRVLFKE